MLTLSKNKYRKTTLTVLLSFFVSSVEPVWAFDPDAINSKAPMEDGSYSNRTDDNGRMEGFNVEDPNLGGAEKGNGMGTNTGDSALDNKENAKCPNTELLGKKMISAPCWNCLFPMVAMGMKVSMGGTDDDIEMPEARSKKYMCTCKGRDGMPYGGTLYSLWMPSKVTEFVRQPGCLATLDGTQLKISRIAAGVNNVDEGQTSEGKNAFLHYHYVAFPLLMLLNMMDSAPQCFKDHYVDIDVLFLSEVDPTWNDDSIAFFTNLEVVLFNNPVGVVACMPDAISSSFLRRPIDSLFWCAGSWGLMYPFTGNVSGGVGPLRASSLMSAKMLSALHRRGFLMITYGDDYVCEGGYTPRMPKSQYKMSMLYPVPESKSAHVIGESTLVWGTARVVPTRGEDFVYLLWNWSDCCLGTNGVTLQ